MLLKLNKYAYLVAALFFFAIATIIEFNLLKKHPEKHLIKDFQDVLNKNELELKATMEEFGKVLSAKDFRGNIGEAVHDLTKNLTNNGQSVLVYRFEKLQYWSNRLVAFNDRLDVFERINGLIQLRNGYYLITSLKVNDYDILGLLQVKYNYSYENKYLRNVFYDDYKLPVQFKLQDFESPGSFPVYNTNKELIFYVKPAGQFLCTKNQLALPGLIYLFGLILLLFYFRREFLESEIQWILKLFSLAGALFIVYWFHLIIGVPKVFYHLKIFSPYDFALNDWLPSLGDFFLLSLFFLFWIYNFSTGLNVREIEEESHMPGKFIITLLLLFCAGMYLFANYFIEKLIYNSTISFSLNQITSITTQSALALLSVGLLLAAIILLTLKISDESKNQFGISGITIVVFLIVVLVAVLQYISAGKIDYSVLGLFLSASVLATLFDKGLLGRYMISYLIVFVSAASVYSIILFYHTIGLKERESQKLMAVTLVTEHDPAAEIFLADIQNQIIFDQKIPFFILNDERERLSDYLEQTYFNGYFRKYNTSVWVCSASDDLFIENENRNAPCLKFFKNLFSTYGTPISGTNFYFMDKMNGRISYAGNLNYPLSGDSNGVSIFIEMESDLLFEGIGFPELLIDKSMSKPDYYTKFNYAKYYGGELTDKNGDYNYNTYVDSYVTDSTEFQVKKRDGYEHLIYHTLQDNFIIVSRKTFTPVDYLISFPYLFVFYFVIALFLLSVSNYRLMKKTLTFDLKFKIQTAIISIVFLSLLVVAMATLFYNIEGYKSKHRNDLNEKMKSIAEEVDNRFEDIFEITPELKDWLNIELLKLSNIFRTDINIYDPEGWIISSSRPEIFNRGLVSDRINSQAKYEIEQNLSVYFQPEKIGLLSYLSAYRPIVNNRGDLIGIINLPYFIRQDNYSQEISTFIVAFINLYVLLLLASIIIAVFIANQITRPLVVIQKNLQKMEFGKPNEPIHYNRKDEIGSLVHEYNKKVEELAVSAELLARSERETAWREMAKQIAHEIKNPLTPMKLNIQYLLKTKSNSKEYSALVERVSATLIEQIDNLSNIATEFSNFAKIPTARNQIFNLSQQVLKVIELFETSEQISIEFHTNGCDNIEVNADREQLGRAIINLIKNGIQAIPEKKSGKIDITLYKRENKAIITVTDNGTGIDEELRDKLFSPSFTTKSSGMGLGLAIVKNIVENFSGNVWFETEIGKGTTFFVEIPLYEDAKPKINIT